MDKKMINEDADVENIGIMQGFLDSMDDEGDDEDDETPEELMDRRPDSPEILMNNLRGDMRSIDARRDELADLVGYAAASETPETVLAMLQPVLAQQGGGGIGALPQSQPMAQGPQPPMMEGMPGMPPPGMPPLPEGAPPMMPGADMAPPPQDGGIAALLAGAGGAGGAVPPGMPPSDQPPIQMARGGYVQRFSEGSDEDGVTPAEDETSSLGFDVTPEMVADARAQFLATMQRRPTALPDLRTAAAERAKVYQDVMGDNTDSRQAQMLLSLGQRAFGYAANVDDAGRPLRGSGLSRLAGAVRTLPGEMAQYISAADKEQRQAKLLGLQSAEKDIESIRASNLKLLETQRKGYADVLKSANKTGQANPFGNSLAGRSLDMFVRYAPLYAKGGLDDDTERYFLSAVTSYTQPTVTEYTDPLTGEKTLRTQQNKLPEFVTTALKARNTLPPRAAPPSGPATTPVPAGASDAAPVEPVRVAPSPDPVIGMGADPATLPEAVRPVVQNAPQSTFFDLSGTGTGFVPVIVSGIARNIPIEAAGQIKPEFQQGTTMLENMRNRVVNVLQENPRFAEGERTQILRELDIGPRALTNKQAYLNQIVALDNVFDSIQTKTQGVADTKNTGMDARREAYKKLEEVNFIRDLLGVRERKINTTEAWKSAPPGEYLVFDPNRKVYVYARKKGTP